MLKAEHRSGFDYLVGDAMSIYPGLTKFRRHFVYLRPGYIIVVDELAAKEPSRFEWLMRVEETLEQRAESRFLVRNGGVVMDVQFLLPERLEAKASERLLTAAAGPAGSCVISSF